MTPTPVLTPRVLNSLRPRAKEFTLPDPQCHGLRLRVHPQGTKSWVTSLRQGGRSKRITLGHWPDMNIEMARATSLALRTGVAQPDTPYAPKPIRFGDLAAAFVTRRLPAFKPSTRGPFLVYLNRQLLPAFGGKMVTAIQPPDVADWFYAYSRTRPGGANQALGHFTTIWNWGKSEGLLATHLPNPAAPIRKNRRKARGQMLSLDQLRLLAKTLDQVPARSWLAAQAIRLILLTGCRRGEILSLRWSDVQNGAIALRGAKTGPREVVLSDLAAITLRNVRQKTGEGVFVFPSAKSVTGHIGTVDGTWAALKRTAGLPLDIRIHDLRHTYASHAILAGETLTTTGRLLGHRSPHSTERYAHLDGGALIKAADNIAQVIEGLMGERE